MAHHFFALLARMKYIDRWALMRNTRREDLAEHSHTVAVLAHALAVIGRERFGATVDPNEAAVAGLYHDAPEILTGDLPTPVKYDNPALRAAYRTVEENAAGQLLSMLPVDLRESFAPYVKEELEPELLAVVKAADKLSAYLKCLEERQAGNPEFARAERQCRQALDEMPLPALQVFLEEFLPGYLMTLDEVQEGVGQGQ